MKDNAANLPLPPMNQTADEQTKAEKRAAQARINGSKSRGPITIEGRAKSSKNALVHGHAAKVNVLTQHDDIQAYDAHLAGNLEDYEHPEEKIAEALHHLPQVG